MKTAVEFLLEKLKLQGLLIGEPDNLIVVREAIELEKQQIINANWEASEDTERAEEYYFNTYKKPYYGIVAEELWKHFNPNSNRTCPNSLYISTEKNYIEWQNAETTLNLFEWCINFKNK
jgi:hypothetical protein